MNSPILVEPESDNLHSRITLRQDLKAYPKLLLLFGIRDRVPGTIVMGDDRYHLRKMCENGHLNASENRLCI
jgi:hypothetical protein